jgi:hypothetical protein
VHAAHVAVGEHDGRPGQPAPHEAEHLVEVGRARAGRVHEGAVRHDHRVGPGRREVRDERLGRAAEPQAAAGPLGEVAVGAREGVHHRDLVALLPAHGGRLEQPHVAEVRIVDEIPRQVERGVEEGEAHLG